MEKSEQAQLLDHLTAPGGHGTAQGEARVGIAVVLSRGRLFPVHPPSYPKVRKRSPDVFPDPRPVV
ncbi:hypothetical protein [Corynebacterium efficiens YS-314]|uniref:Uncharacterized protein n=1 Tax=Corynebacterium efficiens (strain DSM 44549 / YS-314 / AJ 12310 / JCM 11189 / NBRC 100395) TaxID=196164 RepID=Q8FPZ2_COREF|nr:hypothetical protein [Corynebacterium efficiens YS-314]